MLWDTDKGTILADFRKPGITILGGPFVGDRYQIRRRVQQATEFLVPTVVCLGFHDYPESSVGTRASVLVSQKELGRRDEAVAVAHPIR
jgi:hypothetical protein